MKTIQIDREDETALLKILSENGMEKYSKRIENATSFLEPSVNINWVNSETITFYCTGYIENIKDLKSRGANKSEIYTVGYFYGPDGKMYDTSHLDEFWDKI